MFDDNEMQQLDWRAKGVSISIDQIRYHHLRKGKTSRVALILQKNKTFECEGDQRWLRPTESVSYSFGKQHEFSLSLHRPRRYRFQPFSERRENQRGR